MGEGYPIVKLKLDVIFKSLTKDQQRQKKQGDGGLAASYQRGNGG